MAPRCRQAPTRSGPGSPPAYVCTLVPLCFLALHVSLEQSCPFSLAEVLSSHLVALLLEAFPDVTAGPERSGCLYLLINSASVRAPTTWCQRLLTELTGVLRSPLFLTVPVYILPYC